MGQRRELRSPEGTRKMLKDSRRLAGRLKKDLLFYTSSLETEQGKYKALEGRYQPILRLGRLILVKDLFPKKK